jgi:hypothetical protein
VTFHENTHHHVVDSIVKNYYNYVMILSMDVRHTMENIFIFIFVKLIYMIHEICI